MSGNYDFPPASSPSSSSSPPADAGSSSIPARFQNIRQTLQRERERDRVSWDSAAADRSREYSNQDMPSAGRSSTASHRHLSGPRGAPPPFRSGRRVTHSSEGPPSSSLGRRPRSSAREAHPMSRARRALTTRDHYTSLRHPHHADQVSSHLTDLLDPNSFRRSSPFPNLEAYLANGTLEDYEEDESRQRLKRRKLDHADTQKPPSTVAYGHFGQVVAGSLRMEIVSCDGGQLRDDSRLLYRAENVLRNDKSVYCTEQPQCNLLLHHQNGVLFSLEKLIIKSPDKGFTAPVQEGLVFVSMSSDRLVSRANQYTIQYVPSCPQHRPRSRRRHRSPAGDDGQSSLRTLTLLEAINDEETWNTYQRQRDRSSSEEGGVPLTPRFQDENDSDNDWHQHLRQSIADNCEWATAEQILSGQFDPPRLPRAGEDPSPRDFRAPTPPPPPQIQVTTDSDDANFTDVEEESTAADILADRSVREARWRNSGFIDDIDGGVDYSNNGGSSTTNNNDDTDILPPLGRMWPDRNAYDRYSSGNSGPTAASSNRWGSRRHFSTHYQTHPAPYISAMRRLKPSLIQAQTTPGAAEGTGSSTTTTTTAAAAAVVANPPGEKPAEPHARFFIPADKSAVAVKFDPPICGRFVLLKLFGPAPGSNIDVQSVIAYGYAGQRFFPACRAV